MEEACGQPMLHTEYKGISQVSQVNDSHKSIVKAVFIYNVCLKYSN